MKPKLILIRGFPASGKSTIAEELRKKLKKSALFNLDYFTHIIGGSKRNKEDKETAFDFIIILSKELAKKNYTIIIDELFIFKEEIDKVIKEFNPLHYDIHIITLISPINILIQNDSRRKPQKVLGPERLKKIYSLFKNSKTIEKGKIIDTSKETIESATNQIYNFISGA